MPNAKQTDAIAGWEIFNRPEGPPPLDRLNEEARPPGPRSCVQADVPALPSSRSPWPRRVPANQRAGHADQARAVASDRLNRALSATALGCRYDEAGDAHEGVPPDAPLHHLGCPMSSQSEVNRLRNEIQGLQQKIAPESARVATARREEASNRERASKASSATSASSRSKEADRQAKAAVAAEKKRADLEKKLAAKQKSLHTAEARLGKKRDEEQRRAIKKLQTRAQTAERQFRPSSSDLSPAVFESSAAPEHDVFISHASEDKEDVARPAPRICSSDAVWRCGTTTSP